jgi:hypothetical protein
LKVKDPTAGDVIVDGEGRAVLYLTIYVPPAEDEKFYCGLILSSPFQNEFIGKEWRVRATQAYYRLAGTVTEAVATLNLDKPLASLNPNLSPDARKAAAFEEKNAILEAENARLVAKLAGA